jgi:hypothetical protein
MGLRLCQLQTDAGFVPQVKRSIHITTPNMFLPQIGICFDRCVAQAMAGAGYERRNLNVRGSLGPLVSI